MTLLAKKRISYLRWVSQLVVITLSFLASVFAVAQPRFFISGEGAFLEQMHDGTAYTLVNSNIAASSDHSVGPLRYIKPGHKLSGGGKIGVLLPSGFDLQFSFFTHHHSASDSLSNPDDNILDVILLPSSLGPTAGAFFASSSVALGMNLFNLTLGYPVHVSSLFNLHPYVGLDLSDIEVKQTTFYDIVPNPGTDSVGNVREASSVRGLGPIVGTALNYTFFPSLSLVSDISIAMLMGKSRNSFKASRFNDSGIPLFGDPTDIRGRVSLNFEKLNVKIGLRYQRTLARLSQMGITLGYRITKYIRAVSSYNFPDSTQASLLATQLESPGFEGPFFSITLMS